MTKLPRILFAGLMASTMLAGPVMAASPMAGEKLADDQTFTYRVLDSFVTFDPQLIESFDDDNVARQIFEGLYNEDADGNVVPGVATGYDVNDDKTVYTFHLRPEAKWSNGDPVTAADFVYGWQRLVDPANASQYAWYGELMSIENSSEIVAGDMAPDTLGVKAIDDHTLQVNLTTPLSYFPKMLTLGSTFPAHRATIEEWGSDWTSPEHIVGNGAFVLTENVPGERTVLERSPTYWDNEHTILNKIVALIVNDENVALTRYLAGEFDRTEIPAGQYPKLKAEYPDQAISFPRLCSYYYMFNMTDTTNPAFKDLRVREALSLAVDRDIIVNNILAGGQFPAYTFTPAATAGFEVPDVEAANMSQAERDAQARELLADAGYGPDNPLKFDMIYNTSEAHKKIAVAMTQMWKQKLGAEVTLGNMEWATFLTERQNQNYELARGAWCGDYNEASTFLDLLTTNNGSNDGKYSNAAYDTLIEEAKTASDTQALYTEAEQLIAADVPVIPIYHYAGVYMIDTDLKGWPVDNVQQHWFGKDLYKVAE